jgi:hypothetical protein
MIEQAHAVAGRTQGRERVVPCRSVGREVLSRFEGGTGSIPEELIGSAHAS